MLWVFAGLGTLVPVIALGCVLAGMDPFVLGDVAGASIFVGILGVLATAKTFDSFVMRWCVASTLAHLGWEMPWVLLANKLVGVTEKDHWAFLFWTYGTADARYITNEAGAKGIETLTSFIVAPIVIWVLTLLKKDQRKAHLLLLIASACQLYGAILYFVEEAYRGFPAFASEPIDLYVKVVGLNGIWVIVPFILILRLAKLNLRPS